VAWNIPYVLGCVFLRPLFKSLSPPGTLAASALCAALAIAGCASSGSVAVFAVFYALFGIALAFFWPMLMGWRSSGLEGGELGKGQARYNLSWCLGIVVGPYLAGLLSEKELSLPLWAAAGVFMALAMAMGLNALALARRGRKTGKNAAESEPDTCGGDTVDERGTPIRYLAWIGLFSAYFAAGASWNVFPIYLNEVLGHSKPVIGGLFLTRSVAMSIAFILLGSTTFWHFKTYPLIAAQVAFAATVLVLIPLKSHFALAVDLAVFGVISAFCYSSAVFHGVAGAREKARRVALHEAILASSTVSGSVLAGLAYQEFSMVAVFAGCAALCLLAAAAQTVGAILIKRTNQNRTGN
jgi:MFS family permease